VLEDDVDLVLEIFDLALLEGGALLGREVVGLEGRVVRREGLRGGRGEVQRLVVLLPQVPRDVRLSVHSDKLYYRIRIT
jgi:hypothetical protein